jgi:predicted transcriptional regulator
MTWKVLLENGPRSASDIRKALSTTQIEADRIINAAVDAGKITRNYNNSESRADWTYSLPTN